MSDKSQASATGLSDLLAREEPGAERAVADPGPAEAGGEGRSGAQSPVAAAARDDGTIPFDFSRTSKISRRFEENLGALAEAFGKSASVGLTSMLRANTSLTYRGLDVTTFGEYARSMPPLTCASVFGLPPLNGRSLLEIDLKIVNLFVLRLLGGPIGEGGPGREFTDIELGIVGLIVEKLLAHLCEGAEKIVALRPEFVHLENDPARLGTMTSGEPVILMRFVIGVEEQRGPLTLCIPLTGFEPVRDEFDPEESAECRTPAEVRRDRDRLFEVIKGATADVVVQLGESGITFEKIMELEEGDVVPLCKSLQSPLVLEVQGRPMFRGVAGKLDQNRALKIIERLDEKE